ncbi:MAG: GGDEF and EAL domain-containing protein [Spirochaetes bacterium]|nr:GGDEF and EAL domain-containing protein [Spirochaetota bacterium]
MRQDDILREKILKKRILFLILGIFIYIIGDIIFIFYSFNKNKKQIFNEINKNLINACTTIPESVIKFNNEILDNKKVVSDDEQHKNTVKLSNHCNKFKITSLSTLIKKGNIIYYTLSSSTDDEFIEGTYFKFHDTNYNDIKNLISAFTDKTIVIEVYKGKDGDYQTAYVPHVTSNGNVFIVTGSIGYKKINELIKSSNIHSMSIFIFFLIIILPLIIFKYKFLKSDLYFLKRSIYTDPLTHRANRNSLLLNIKSDNFFTLFLINVDSFKEVNDLYGFDSGDYILVEICKRLNSLLIDDDYMLFKMQSDEFAILVKRDLSDKEIEVLVHYFNESIIETPFIYKNFYIHITVTFGVAKSFIEDEKINNNNLLSNCDLALKEALKFKRNFYVYDRKINNSQLLNETIIWSKKLNNAIKNDCLVPYFQPIINNNNGVVEKYECLVRLIDDGKPVSPFYFLNIAKKTKHYYKITQIMIHKSFTVFSKLEKEFSINISVDDIIDHETNIFIMSMIKENLNIRNKLVFELVESEGIENYEVVKNFIDNVKSYGVKIAVDDFGTGYSNFSHILKLNVDYIKIDSSLVKNILNDKMSYIIVKNINNFAKELGLKTIAEFVCSKEIQDMVIDIGIDYSQGYFIGEPKEKLKI